MSRGEMLQVWQRSRFRFDDFAEDTFFETMSKCPFIRSMRTSGERMDSLQRWDKTMEFTIADKYKSKQQCCCWKSDQIQLIVLMAMRMIFDGLGLYSSLQSHGRGKHQQTGEKSKQFVYLRIKTKFFRNRWTVTWRRWSSSPTSSSASKMPSTSGSVLD